MDAACSCICNIFSVDHSTLNNSFKLQQKVLQEILIMSDKKEFVSCSTALESNDTLLLYDEDLTVKDCCTIHLPPTTWILDDLESSLISLLS